MTLNELNRSPEFTKHLISARAFEKEPMSVVDVGARGGFETFWSFYKDQVKLIGFEPDVEECNRLNKQASSAKNRYFPFALAESKDKKIFYIAAYIWSSGFYKANMKFMHRFPDEANLKVVKAIEIDTVDLDSFSRENNLTPIEFIKLDVEGGELSVLKGSEKLLRRSVIGLSIEVAFCRYRENLPFFSDIDLYLRSLGFELFDLSLRRHRKNALPEPKWLDQDIGWTKRGQLIWGQALYLRDAVAELDPDCTRKLEDAWTDAKILKLASLFEIFNLHDCAIELLQVAQQKELINTWNVDELINHLVPDKEGRTFQGFEVGGGNNSITYQEYMEEISRVGSQSKPQKTHNSNGAGRLIRKVIPRPIGRFIKYLLVKLRNFIDRILRI
jgi:FkbM family methyltransferase